MPRVMSDDAIGIALDGQLEQGLVIGIAQLRRPAGTQGVRLGCATKGVEHVVDVGETEGIAAAWRFATSSYSKSR